MYNTDSYESYLYSPWYSPFVQFRPSLHFLNVYSYVYVSLVLQITVSSKLWETVRVLLFARDANYRDPNVKIIDDWKLQKYDLM